MTNPDSLKCPVCRARSRGDVTCPRCAADLEPLLGVIGRAAIARQHARVALEKGHWREARAWAETAQRLQATPLGRQLRALTRICAPDSLE